MDPLRSIGWPAIRSRVATKDGGASRDRTGDLKLAKLALSQLSYGPDRKAEYTEQESEDFPIPVFRVLLSEFGGPGTS